MIQKYNWFSQLISVKEYNIRVAPTEINNEHMSFQFNVQESLLKK